MDYRLVANDFYVGRLKRKLSKKDFVDDKKKRSLFIYIYQPQPKTIIDVLYLKDLSL